MIDNDGDDRVFIGREREKWSGNSHGTVLKREVCAISAVSPGKTPVRFIGLRRSRESS